MTGLRFALTVVTVVLLAEMSPEIMLSAQGATSPGANLSVGPESEIGIRLGLGGLSYIDDRPGPRNVIGVEACLLCGRRALFVEYSHWTRPRASYRTGYRSADTITAGLRLQGQSRVRPFFDAGVAIGNLRYGSCDITVAGGTAGTGMTIQVNQAYVRFGGRFLVAHHVHGYGGGLYGGGDLSVGGGWRF